MTGRLAILCPGQGGQHTRMFDLLEQGPDMRRLIDQWSLQDCLPVPLDEILHDNGALFSNRAAQPLIVAAALAAWECVKAALPTPSLVAGYSIGELAAYAVAEAVTPGAALSLAALRAQRMDECVEASSPQAMLAIAAPNLKTVLDAAIRARLFVAIETGTDSAIVGGLREDALAFKSQLQDAATRAVLLPVNVASHTPLMHAAVAPFHQALLDSSLAPPAIPVVSGVTACMVRRADEAADTLSQQISKTIRWRECMDSCAEQGISVALELGPGNALSRMLHERHPQIACRSVADFRSVEGIGKWIQRAIEA